jgi:hypothetical protein
MQLPPTNHGNCEEESRTVNEGNENGIKWRGIYGTNNSFSVLLKTKERVEKPGKMEGRKGYRLYKQKPIKGIGGASGKPNEDAPAGEETGSQMRRKDFQAAIDGQCLNYKLDIWINTGREGLIR